jgi:hypothetical protein
MGSKSEKQRRKELTAAKPAENLATAKARLSEKERHIVDKYFEVLQPHCRTASIAEYRRTNGQESPFASKMGGQFVGAAAGAWPQSGDDYLEGVLQINISELPWVPERLQQFKLIQFLVHGKTGIARRHTRMGHGLYQRTRI